MTEVTVEGMLGMALPVTTAALPRWHQELLAQELTTAGAAAARRKRQRFGATPRGRRIYQSDRFIPSRAAMDMDYCHYMVDAATPSTMDAPAPATTTPPLETPPPKELDHHVRYKETLAANLLFQSPTKTKTLLRFHDDPATESMGPASPSSSSSPSSSWSVSSSPSLRQPKASLLTAPAARHRHIPSSPTRILDAPDLRDDYYLNLVSWGANNLLAVALDQVVYLYNTETGAIQEIAACSARGDYVTSVAWMRSAVSGGGGGSGAGGMGPMEGCEGGGSGSGPGGGGGGGTGVGDRLAIGTARAELQIWDPVTNRRVERLAGHHDRIGALAWNGPTLSSGARDARILHHDLRAPGVVGTLIGHQQEVCGLAWSPDGRTLASGGNDNCLLLWDSARLRGGGGATTTTTTPRHRLVEHTAAVKALAWCPWERHLLASGGGTADRSIKFWHAATGRRLHSVATGSQVCGLVWSPTERELLSSHGFSQHELCLWRYPSMARLREFTGHTARVLHLARSPDGRTVVSAAADETLRFWNVFAPPPASARGREGLVGGVDGGLGHCRRRLFADTAVIR